MATDISFCHLTTRDHLILEAMLERCPLNDEMFKQMLQRKVRDSRLYLRDDLPEDVATLDRWVTYKFDGQMLPPRQLVEQEHVSAADDKLSVHTCHGLALLGQAEGATIMVGTDNGPMATIRLVKVVPVPPDSTAKKPESIRPSGSVVSFPARKVPQINPEWHPDDDPGPSAA